MQAIRNIPRDDFAIYLALSAARDGAAPIIFVRGIDVRGISLI